MPLRDIDESALVKTHVTGWEPWRTRTIATLFWVLSAISLPVLMHLNYSPFGWDLHVYTNAMRSLQTGHDPYADGIAVQRAFHVSGQANNPDVMPPYTYVYSPMTLPLLRIFCGMHWPGGAAMYWVLYGAGLLAMIWAGVQMAEPSERTMVLIFAPMAAFFPGLLQTNVIFSGNLAYILYGLVMATAVLGWRRGLWQPFYGAVLIASCFKAPLLSLALIPALSARGQWVRAGATAVSGVLLFLIQPILWPSLFRNYLQAVGLQFTYNHDFGLSPSGLLGNTLYSFHAPYSFASTLFYFCYAVPVSGVLLWLSRRYFSGAITLERWVPVMVVGVVLLNPRIKEYDIAPLSVPLALLCWRIFGYRNTLGRTVLESVLFFVAINGIVSNTDTLYKPMAGLLLLALFVVGVWQLGRDETRSKRITGSEHGMAKGLHSTIAAIA
jgi:hypothetical protein